MADIDDTTRRIIESWAHRYRMDFPLQRRSSSRYWWAANSRANLGDLLAAARWWRSA